jgi:regulatory protein
MKKIDSPLNYALYLLELRDRSVFELGGKMKLKGFSETDIAETVKFLLDKKFLDDERFTKNYVRGKQLAGDGKNKIRFKLMRFRVDKEIVEQSLEGEDEGEFAKAFEFGKKIFDRNEGLERGKLYQKLMGSLYRKGFDLDTAKEVVMKLMAK